MSWNQSGEEEGERKSTPEGRQNLPAIQETPVQYLGQEDLLEKGQATHSSILAWRIPWTVESMGLQSQT